ncbi:MAG: hypothetical protein NTW28_01925 [Candidatus Solibacter sp.]|nr:hypothetical protein [Candidatus Solibacter sp.]
MRRPRLYIAAAVGAALVLVVCLFALTRGEEAATLRVGYVPPGWRCR